MQVKKKRWQLILSDEKWCLEELQSLKFEPVISLETTQTSCLHINPSLPLVWLQTPFSLVDSLYGARPCTLKDTKSFIASSSQMSSQQISGVSSVERVSLCFQSGTISGSMGRETLLKPVHYSCATHPWSHFHSCAINIHESLLPSKRYPLFQHYQYYAGNS